jgi:hypothetical protein
VICAVQGSRRCTLVYHCVIFLTLRHLTRYWSRHGSVLETMPDSTGPPWLYSYLSFSYQNLNALTSYLK